MSILDVLRAAEKSRKLYEQVGATGLSAALEAADRFRASASGAERALEQMNTLTASLSINDALKDLIQPPRWQSAILEAQERMAERDALLRSVTDFGLSSKLAHVEDFARSLGGRGAFDDIVSRSVGAIAARASVSDFQASILGVNSWASVLAERVRGLDTEGAAVAEWLGRFPVLDEAVAGEDGSRLEQWLKGLKDWFADVAALPRSPKTTSLLVLVVWVIFKEFVWPLSLDVAGNETSALLESGDVARERAERRHHEQLVSQALAEIGRQLNSLPVALEPHAATIVRTRAIVRESPHVKAKRLDHLAQGVSVRVLEREGQWFKIEYIADGQVLSVGWTYRLNLTLPPPTPD